MKKMIDGPSSNALSIELFFSAAMSAPVYPANSTITAPRAMKLINANLRDPTVSFKKTHPIIAANTVDVSRNTAASPTLSR